jgi:hypothetical protein
VVLKSAGSQAYIVPFNFFDMTLVFILATFLVAAAAIYMLHFLVKILSAWWRQERMRNQGQEVQAKIVQLEVIDGEDRTIPFVRMQVEINKRQKFICTAEGFYPRSELPYLQAGNFVSVVLPPTDEKKVLLVKSQLTNSRPKETTAALSIPMKRKLSVA